MKRLTPKQQRFVAEYLIDFNATQAAIRSGYSAKTACKIGGENLRKPAIYERIQARFNELQRNAEIRQEEIVAEEKCIAFSDIGEAIPELKELIPDANVRRAISSFEHKILPDGTEIRKYRLWDKGQSLQRLSRQLGLYQDKQEVDVNVSTGPTVEVIIEGDGKPKT